MKSKRLNGRHHRLSVKGFAALCLALAACTNQSGPVKKSATGTTTGYNSSVTTGTTQSSVQYTIQSVSIAKDTQAIPNGTVSVDERVYPFVATLVLQTSLTSLPKIGDVCTLSADPQTASCFCRFQWQDVSLPAGSSRDRIAETPIRGTASNQISPQCSMPAAYASEIPKNTVISISIFSREGQTTVPVASNVYAKTKTDDLFGQEIASSSFKNVQRYTCTRKFKKGMSLRSAQATFAKQNGGNPNKTFVANRFCYVVSDGTSSGRSGSKSGANFTLADGTPIDCDGGEPALDYSGQGYLFNLYITSDEVPSSGYVENENYLCSVDDSRRALYPLDSQFMLAKQSTKDLTKPVVAQSCLGNQNGSCILTVSTYNSPGCDNSVTGSAATQNGIVRRCLGWAAPREVDGSCRTISIKNASNVVQPVKTFPLRRYVAMYPYIYDVNGRPVPMVDTATNNNGTQLAPSVLYDEVYVLDRPVGNSGYTMRGALPCPMSYYDSAQKNYSLSFLSSSALAGKTTILGRNIDGVQWPNVDANSNSLISVPGSCSASIPVAEYDAQGRGQLLGLATLGASVSPRLKEAFVNPQQPFSPVYYEDTSFQACAPESTTYSDPYVITSTDNNQWCAMVAPNYSGDLQKGTKNGTYLPQVGSYQAGLNKYKIPLTADDDQIRDALDLKMNTMHRDRRAPASTNYTCSVTQDQNGTRSRLGLSPGGGCCPNYNSGSLGKKCTVPNY